MTKLLLPLLAAMMMAGCACPCRRPLPFVCTGQIVNGVCIHAVNLEVTGGRP